MNQEQIMNILPTEFAKKVSDIIKTLRQGHNEPRANNEYLLIAFLT